MRKWLKRRKAINITTLDVYRTIQWFPLPITIMQAALIVRRRLAEQGINVSLMRACRKVEKQHRKIAGRKR